MPKQASVQERLHDAKYGVAVLITCLVQELERQHDGFTDRFLRRLGKAYGEIRDEPRKTVDYLEMVNWTRELLTGFSPFSGQGKPFLDEN